MALRWALIILGIIRPLLLLLISSMAEALGVGVPMPTFWAVHKLAQQYSRRAKEIFFMILKLECRYYFQRRMTISERYTAGKSRLRLIFNREERYTKITIFYQCCYPLKPVEKPVALVLDITKTWLIKIR
jgi:hypothetical protein